MTVGNWRSRLLAFGLLAAAGFLAAGCEDDLTAGSGRSLRPVSAETLAQMDAIGSTSTAPVLIRTYKKEAELQIWKMKKDGQYALLKTYPMCRWSGQLGPKTREGDRQVPEGFYPITPAQMNPNSNYYLSFNVGYPNAYDRAFGRTGGTIMVHGACSSAGCFSMTDAQIAEIYAIARDAFNAGQTEIQMQSYPFKMTAENLAKHRLDPNIDFWKQLKNGSDHFEVAKTEPSVLVCGKHYVFGAHAEGEVSATAPCPPLKKDDQIEAAVAEKDARDNAAVAQLVAQGVKPVRLVYEDGGQNLAFAGRFDVSRPDALVGPQEIVLDDRGNPIPEVVKVAAAAQPAIVAPSPVAVAQATGAPALKVASANAVVADSAPQTTTSSSSPLGFVSGVAGGVAKKWFKVGDEPAPLQVFEPAEPIPSDVPLPPRRSALLDSNLRMASANAKTEVVPADAATL